MIFVGDDWAEAHHDICVENDVGEVLVRRRVPEGVDRVAQFHALVADYVEDPVEVVIGIETERGLFVEALMAAGYTVIVVDPYSSSRYRDRHSRAGAKSDPGDAKVLADLVRTDRQHHRAPAGDSELAEALKVLARTHQNLVWNRQRQLNHLRDTLVAFYPAALQAFGHDLDHHDCLHVLLKAPTPAAGRAITQAKIESALRRGGRLRGIEQRSMQIRAALRTEQLRPTSSIIENAMGLTVKTTVEVIIAMSNSWPNSRKSSTRILNSTLSGEHGAFQSRCLRDG